MATYGAALERCWLQNGGLASLRPASRSVSRCWTPCRAAHLVLIGTMDRPRRPAGALDHGGGAIVDLRGRLRHSHQHITAAGPPPAAPEQAADAMTRVAGLDEAAQAAVLDGNVQRELRRVAVRGGQRG